MLYRYYPFDNIWHTVLEQGILFITALSPFLETATKEIQTPR